MSDPTTTEVLGALASPLTTDDQALTRRRFLQAVAAGMTVAAAPAWMAEAAAAATPSNRSDGVLVVLTMAGGNDGLNTFVPTSDGAYYDARRSLAISPDQAIPLGGGRGLNPHLPFVKRLWDQGRVAVVDGVGHNSDSLSHFVSMANVMAASNSRPPFNTGWLGRFLDDAGDNPFTGLSLGGAIPLLMKGRTKNAIGLPHQGKDILATTGIKATYARQNDAIRAFGLGPSGLGSLGDQVSAAGQRAVDYAGTISPLFDDREDEPRLVTKMRLAARLINADLGVRVISIVFGDFDSHAGQVTMHRDRMREMSAGLQTFYATLKPTLGGRTLIVGTSEFGRRVKFNGSGTDHGTANSLFVIGDRVKPGFHGSQPSLRKLDRDGNPVTTVDMMSFYSTIAATWLGADANALLGRSYENLGFVNAPGASLPTSATTPATTAITTSSGGAQTRRQQRAAVAQAYLALINRLPGEAHFEKVAESHLSGNRSLASVADAVINSAVFAAVHGSPSDQQLVDIAFQAIRQRKANANEHRLWARRRTSGSTTGDLVATLINNLSADDAFALRTHPIILKMEMTGPIGRLYHAYFLRPPANRGLNHWINSGLGVSAVSDNFASSAEFKRRYGNLNNRQFVDLVFRNVLGRSAATDGLAYWSDLLDRGRSRGQIMVGFSDSDEFKRKVKAYR